MGDLTTYSFSDLVPVTREVYLRLFVRQNEAIWPFHLVAVALGLTLLVRLWRRNDQFAGTGLALCWLYCGWSFHLELYANLNWAATYFGYVFFIQAGLLVLSDFNVFENRTPSIYTHRFGIATSIIGLAYPLLQYGLGRSVSGLEVSGISPDPTAITSLGIILLLPRSRWYSLIIPVLWSLNSGLTTLTLGIRTWPLPVISATVVGTWVACHWFLKKHTKSAQ